MAPKPWRHLKGVEKAVNPGWNRNRFRSGPSRISGWEDCRTACLGRAASIFSKKPVAPKSAVDIVRLPFRPVERVSFTLEKQSADSPHGGNVRNFYEAANAHD